MQIKNLPINSWVMDPNTMVNGAPIKWRILNHNHIGYPVNTTTLIGVINTSNPKLVKPLPYNSSTKETFVDFDSNIGGVVKTIKQNIAEIYDLMSKGLKGKMVDTVLDIGYSGAYAANAPRFRKETHKVFFFGSSEMNYGSGTSVRGATSQKYFPALSAYSNTGLGNYLGLGEYARIMGRDIAISSSDYNRGYPAYLSKQASQYVTNPLMELILAPMINITSETMISGQDENGIYLLEVSEKKYILKIGEGLYVKDNVGELVRLSQTELTKDLFITQGMSEVNSITESQWGQFSESLEILCFKEEAQPMQLKITTETLYDESNKRYAGSGYLKVDEIDLPSSATGFMIEALSEGVTFKVYRDGVLQGEKVEGQLHRIKGGAKLELFAELDNGILDAVALLWI